MSNTANTLTEAPPETPTETTPPLPTDGAARTERHDWIFVGHFSGRPKRNALGLDLYARDPAELVQAVAVFAAREAGGDLYPYIFLAPPLAAEFAEKASAALLDRAKQD